MSAENDLALAYHMGYDDALAKRKPDASKAQVLAPYDLATENAKLRELAHAAWKCIHTGASCSDCRMIAGGCTLQTARRELGIEVDA